MLLSACNEITAAFFARESDVFVADKLSDLNKEQFHLYI